MRLTTVDVLMAQGREIEAAGEEARLRDRVGKPETSEAPGEKATETPENDPPEFPGNQQARHGQAGRNLRKRRPKAALSPVPHPSGETSLPRYKILPAVGNCCHGKSEARGNHPW